MSCSGLTRERHSLYDDALAAVKQLPSRKNITLGEEQRKAAAALFGQGYPIFLERIREGAIVIDTALGMAHVDIPLRYVRSSHLPPAGVRLVAKCVVKGDKDDVVLNHSTDYQPLAYRAGFLEGVMYFVGGVPELKEPSIFVHAESLGGIEQDSGVALSNIVAIPVIFRGTSHPASDATLSVEIQNDQEAITKSPGEGSLPVAEF